MINSHKVTKHACTSSWSPLAHLIHHTYHQVTVMNKQQQERPRAPVVKLSCLQEHVHKKKVLEIVSHHSKYNMFKARNSCIVPGGFSVSLVVLSIGTHVTLAKLYKLADPHMHVKSPGNSRRSRKRYEDISNEFMFNLQISRIWFLQLYYTANR